MSAPEQAWVEARARRRSFQGIGRRSAVELKIHGNRGERGYVGWGRLKPVSARRAIRSRPSSTSCRPRSRVKAKGRLPMPWFARADRQGWLTEQRPSSLSRERIYQMIWDDKRGGGNLWRSLRRRGKRYDGHYHGKNAGRGLILIKWTISEHQAIVARAKPVWETGGRHRRQRRTQRRLAHASWSAKPNCANRQVATCDCRATQKAAIHFHLQPIGDSCTPSPSTTKSGTSPRIRTSPRCALKTKIFSPRRITHGGAVNENTNGLIRDFFPKRIRLLLDFQMPRLPRSNVCSTRDLENPSASVHLKRFSTPSLTLKFLCAGKLNSRFLITSTFEFVLRSASGGCAYRSQRRSHCKAPAVLSITALVPASFTSSASLRISMARSPQ